MGKHCERIRRSAGVLSGVVVFSCTSAAPAAQIAIMAVKHNGAAIAPTNVIQALPGDVVEAELMVSGWGSEFPDGVRAFNIVLQGRKGVASGDNGFVFPKGWNAAIAPIPCSSVEDCLSDEICQFLCVRPGHDPTLGAFLDESRPNYLLQGFLTAAGVNASSLDAVYFGQAIDSAGMLEQGEPLYAGSLILDVGEFACGSFRFQLAPCEATFLVSLSAHQVIYPTMVPLTIQLPECPVLPLSSDPLNCAIDARIPHPPGAPQTSLTWQAIDLFFSGNPVGLTTASFRTREVPAGPPPTVASLTPLVGNAIRANFSQTIETTKWTCLEHRASSREICISHLPGDVNEDGLSEADDVMALVEDLRALPNAPRLPLIRCDMDRSGRCAPVDLLMLTDLLAGRGFSVWRGVEWTEPCPSTAALDSRTRRGACCDRFGGCVGNALESACPAANQRTWVEDADCCEVPCSEPMGACCDMGTGICTNDIPRSNCSSINEAWHENTGCGQVLCFPTLGACCNVDTGGCSDGLELEECIGASSVWLPGYACSASGCIPR